MAGILEGLALTSERPQLELAFTNKGHVHWSGCTGKANLRKWHGWVRKAHMYVQNFYFRAGDDPARDSAHSETWTHCVLTPDRLRRLYRIHGGATQVAEDVFLPDLREGLLVRYRCAAEGHGSFHPHFDFRPHGWNTGPRGYETEWSASDQTLYVWNPSGAPGVVALAASVACDYAPSEGSGWDGFLPQRYPFDAQRGDGGEGEAYRPGELRFMVQASEPVTFAFGWGETREAAATCAHGLLRDHDSLLDAKQARLVSLLRLGFGAQGAHALVNTDDGVLDTSLCWAILSLDALVMNAFGPGVFAGLPWFDQVWGRDQFHSFAGTFLVQGRFDEARAVLARWVDAVDTRPGSPTYGRIPNYISLAQTIYNSADATPLFLNALFEYVKASGDIGFCSEHHERLKIALDGEWTRADSSGFVVHGDQETWMDAQRVLRIGEADTLVPCSPRGNRAVEVQAMWYGALLGASHWAAWIERADDARTWRERAARLRTSFRQEYWNAKEHTLYDHLNADGSKDAVTRPNVLFAINATRALPEEEPLLTPEQEKAVLEDLIHDTLFVPWGVRSMAPGSAFFHPYLTPLGHAATSAYINDGIVGYHPYHEHDGRAGLDHPDWSYHNGDVWHWLTGPAVTALLRYGRVEAAQEMTSTLVEHLLEGNTLGSLAEIMDGNCEPPALGWDKGAFSQAWSLAEFLRVAMDGYLGLSTDAVHGAVTLMPRLPQKWGAVSAVGFLGEAKVWLKLSGEGTQLQLISSGIPATRPVRVIYRFPVEPKRLRSAIAGERPIEVRLATARACTLDPGTRWGEVSVSLSDDKPLAILLT